MSTSRRLSIAWQSDNFEHRELTNTLVLTTPSGWFIDTRIFKTAFSNSNSNSDSDSTSSGIALKPKDIEWTFAGHNKSTPLSEPGTRHSQWTHYVDSHSSLTEEPPKDEGTMSPGEDLGTEKEVGSMINPATGKLEDYVEIWRDDDVPEAAGSRGFVARCDEPGRPAGGFVIRLGGHVAGVLKVGEKLWVERWEGDDDGGWRRSCFLKREEADEGVLPCRILLDMSSPTVGEDFQHRGLTWHIIEVLPNHNHV